MADSMSDLDDSDLVWTRDVPVSGWEWPTVPATWNDYLGYYFDEEQWREAAGRSTRGAEETSR